MNCPRTLLLAVVFLFGPPVVPAVGQAPETGSAPRNPTEQREVIALSATKEDDRACSDVDEIHEFVELPLNYLGIAVRSFDIRRGAPVGIDWSRVRGVVTFFHGGEELPPWLWPWLEAEVRPRNVRVVHLNSFGPLERPDPRAAVSSRLVRWLRAFGLSYDGGFSDNALRIDVELREPALCAHESSPVYARKHLGPRIVDARNRAFVTTFDRRYPHDRRTPVVCGSWGGIALNPWTVATGRADDERRWRIDPVLFLRDALALEGVPAPDPNVLNGRRKFLIHVDGDGFESPSGVRPGALCGKVFLDEIIDRYALPVTVGFIVASLTDDLTDETRTPRIRLAREIAGRPNVEAASHSVLHPLDWRKRHSKLAPRRSVVWYPGVRGYRHDMVAEVTESIRFVNERLLCGDKRCRLMLWSGAANPGAEAVRAAERAGCWNMNGGIARFDGWNDSLAFVRPWGMRVEDRFQVYAGGPNEHVFDGFFSTMPGAFVHASKTLARTGADRIYKPANVYVHFYSAESAPRLAALHAVVKRWGIDAATAPVFASQFAAAVHAAHEQCTVARRASGWALRDFGDCRTARIDGDPREVDFARSRGVLGASRRGDSLFVHLAAPDADVILTPTPVRHPHVEEANHVLCDAVLTPHAVRLLSRSHARREIVLAGFPPCTELALRLDRRERVLRSDLHGRVTLSLAPGGTRVEVRVP